MQQPHDPVAVEKASRVLRARMLRAATIHATAMDARTALALEETGLFTRGSMAQPPSLLLDVLHNRQHPNRCGRGMGPTLFYQDEQNIRFALEMDYLLLSDEQDMRRLAWEHFEEIYNHSPASMTAATHAILIETKEQILAEDRKLWRAAGIRAYDALLSDVCFVITGVKQAVENSFEDGLRKYVPRILQPSIESLEKLPIRFLRPSEQTQEIQLAIERLATLQFSILAKCEQYLDEFGFLPLAGSLSFSSFAERLAGNDKDAIRQIWRWATESGDPVALLQTCCAVLDHPDWIAIVGKQNLLQNIDTLFATGKVKNDVEDDDASYLAFREKLAHYYLNYLELLAPSAIGDVLAVWSWWLGQHVANAFANFPQTLVRFRNVALIPKRQEIDVSWRLANAPVTPSVLATATHWPGSIWTMALAKRLTESNLAVLNDAGSTEALEPLAASITAAFLFGDFPAKQPTAGTYLFEGSLDRCIEDWKRVCGSSDRINFWQQLSVTYRELSDASKFVERLEQAPAAEQVDQVILAHAGRRLSIEGRFPLNQVFDLLNEKNFGQQFFSRLDVAALESISATLIAEAINSGDKYRFAVPHVLVAAAQEIDADGTRRDLLFSLILSACIASYSFGAIERLLKGQKRPNYIEPARKWSATLTDLNRDAPRWIGARGRAAHATIGVCLK